jgi:hypothetical protein
MPPSGVTIVINGGAPRTSINRVDLTLSATDVTEMRFSNDGSTWTLYEPFVTSISDWDLRTYGGNENQGIHTIYFEVRDSVDNTVQASSFIRLEFTKPHVHVGTPVQREDGSFVVDIPYKGFDDFGNKCDLAVAEYSLTGAFSGEQRVMTPRVHDSEHSGTAQLDFSPSGTTLNFVWDALTDIGEGEVSDISQIRIRPVFGSDLGDYGLSGLFVVDTRVLVTTGGGKFVRGELARLQIVFNDSNGDMVDPVSVELVSIKDPSGTEQLYTPIPGTQSYSGEWYVEWEVPLDAMLGKWIATWTYEIDYVVSHHAIYFNVEQAVTVLDKAGQDTCVVHGQLVYADEKPIANTEVQFIPHHISDPTLGQITRIGTTPISVTTDGDGKFVVELIKNTEVIIFIPSLNFRQFAKVPDESSSEFSAMMTLLPVGPRDKFGNRLPS